MGGKTRTNLALESVRTEMLLESAGLRPESQGIPRVLIVVRILHCPYPWPAVPALEVGRSIQHVRAGVICPCL